jgi:hypothetical protein
MVFAFVIVMILAALAAIVETEQVVHRKREQHSVLVKRPSLGRYDYPTEYYQNGLMIFFGAWMKNVAQLLVIAAVGAVVYGAVA